MCYNGPSCVSMGVLLVKKVLSSFCFLGVVGSCISSPAVQVVRSEVSFVQ